MHSSLRLTSLLSLLSTLSLGVFANTPIPDTEFLTSLTTHNGLPIALASRPLFHFGASLSNPTCYPASALDPSTMQQHGVQPSKWPNAAQGCVSPGAPVGHEGQPFPTYFTVSQCSDDEVRVVYNLYFQKDGFSDVIVAKGHVHDWERVVVVWKKTTNATDPPTSQWTRHQLYTSYHSGYMLHPWKSIQNTFDLSNPSEQGGQDKNHPKIYVGWAKHAMFTTRNTGFNDKISQGCKREFRSRDWWWLPRDSEAVAPLKPPADSTNGAAVEDTSGSEGIDWDHAEYVAGGLIPAGKDTLFAQRASAFNWGSARSVPWIVEEKACDVKEGGYVDC